VQRQFVGSAGKHSLQKGFSFFKVVKAYAENCGAPLTTSTRVLDFGCGWGRMVRCFLRDVSTEKLHGVDVDAPMVELCRSLFGTLGRFDQALAGCFTDHDAALADYDAGKFLHAATGGGDYRPASFTASRWCPRAMSRSAGRARYVCSSFATSRASCRKP
jgi:hypothetical protein